MLKTQTFEKFNNDHKETKPSSKGSFENTITINLNKYTNGMDSTKTRRQKHSLLIGEQLK